MVDPTPPQNTARASDSIATAKVVESQVVFTFAWPLSIDALVVVAASGDLQWVLLPSEHAEFNVNLGSTIWPIEEAPPEVVLKLATTPCRFARDLRGAPPNKAARSTLTYGDTPNGYYSKIQAKLLASGDYALIVL